jgi:hypothetical protein
MRGVTNTDGELMINPLSHEMTYELPTTVEQSTGQHAFSPAHHQHHYLFESDSFKSKAFKEATTPFASILHVRA